MADFMEKATRENATIKQLILQKNKNGAMLALKRRKMYEEECNRQ